MTATAEAPAPTTATTPAAADPNAPASTTTNTTGTDWRAGLPADLKDNPAFKEIKGVDELAKGYLAAQDWKSGLPDDVKANESIKNVKSIADLAKMYVGAESKIGAKGIIIPKKDAPPEEWNAYYNALGRPETPDKYEIPKENMPEGIQLDDGIVGKFRQESHTLGLTKDQHAALIRFQANLVAESIKMQEQQTKQVVDGNIEKLRSAWGAAYDQNDRLATDVIKQYGGEEALSKWKQYPELATDPVFAAMFSKMGRELSGSEVKGDGHTRQFTPTPAEANVQALDIINNKANPDHAAYHDHKNPNHAYATEKVKKLFAAAYPEQPKS